MINFSYDTSDLTQHDEQLLSDMKEANLRIMNMAASSFANGAARGSWPNRGSAKIDNALYKRPIRMLKKLIANGEATPQDIEKFKQGFKWKVIDTKGKRRESQGIPFAYCKTKAEANKAARIAHRGLAKVMWGKDLDDINAKVPPSIQRLINKSPALAHLPYNKVTLVQNDEATVFEDENKATNVRDAAVEGEANGLQFAEKTIDVQWRIFERSIKDRVL